MSVDVRLHRKNGPEHGRGILGRTRLGARVFDVIRTLEPSNRGEWEITDVNNQYAAWVELVYEMLAGWLGDGGTVEIRERHRGPGGDVRLQEQIAEALSFQAYEPAPAIDGVWIGPVRKHRSENWWFAELLVLTDRRADRSAPGAAPRELRQLSALHAEPGRVNAFRIQPRAPQHTLSSMLEGSLLVWLVDRRADSPTGGMRQRVLLTGYEPAHLYIPSGVAHGNRGGCRGALLVCAMTAQLDRARPNEGSLS